MLKNWVRILTKITSIATNFYRAQQRSAITSLSVRLSVATHQCAIAVCERR